MSLVAGIIDGSTHVVTVRSDHRRVRWLFRATTGFGFWEGREETLNLLLKRLHLLLLLLLLLTMLTDKVQRCLTIRVTPQPSLGSVVPRTILVSSGQIPERDCHFFPSQPSPRVPVLSIPHCAHPILRIHITAMSPPQLPTDESLQCWIALIDQSSTAGSTEAECLAEVQWLPIVEHVTLSVVTGRCTWRLIAEDRATFDGQCLVCVHECLANGECTGSGPLQVNRDESSGHGRIAGQEERLSLLD